MSYVDGEERSVCFPFPLFSSNQENEFYETKYKFGDFIDVHPNAFPCKISALFVFTYSDLCEMPLMLERMMSEFPFAYYMFIPCQFVRDAFALMIPIYERQEKRMAYADAHVRDCIPPPNIGLQLVMKVPFDFITCLQTTLIHSLGCPIPIIVPTH